MKFLPLVLTLAIQADASAHPRQLQGASAALQREAMLEREAMIAEQERIMQEQLAMKERTQLEMKAQQEARLSAEMEANAMNNAHRNPSANRTPNTGQSGGRAPSVMSEEELLAAERMEAMMEREMMVGREESIVRAEMEMKAQRAAAEGEIAAAEKMAAEVEKAKIKELESKYDVARGYETRNLNQMTFEEREFLAQEGIQAHEIFLDANGNIFAKMPNAKNSGDLFYKVEVEAETGALRFAQKGTSKLPKGKYRGAGGAVRRKGDPRPHNLVTHYADSVMMWVGQISMLPMLLITPSMMGAMGTNGNYGGEWYHQWAEWMGIGDFKTTEDEYGREVWDLEHGAMGADPDLMDACGNYIDTYEWNTLNPEFQQKLIDQGMNGAPCISKWIYDSMEMHTDFRADQFFGCPPSMSYGDREVKTIKNSWDQTEFMSVTFVDSMGQPYDCHGNSVADTLFDEIYNPILMLTTKDKLWDGCGLSAESPCAQIARKPKPCQKERIAYNTGYPIDLVAQCYEPLTGWELWMDLLPNGQVNDGLREWTHGHVGDWVPAFYKEHLLPEEIAEIEAGPDADMEAYILGLNDITDEGTIISYHCNVERDAMGLYTTGLKDGRINTYDDDGPCNAKFWREYRLDQAGINPQRMAMKMALRQAAKPKEPEPIFGNKNSKNKNSGIFGR